MFPAICPADERKNLPNAGTKTTPTPLTKVKALFTLVSSRIHPPVRVIINPFRVGSPLCTCPRGSRQNIRVISWGIQSWSKPIRIG
jgi:hypothetical protein